MRKKINEQKKANHWGLRLQQVIREKKISLRELARRCDVSPSVVSGWIKGNSPTDLTLIKELADDLNISFAWLLTGTYENPNSKPSVAEVFSETPYFDGFARIRIDRLIPRNKDEK